MGLDMFAYTTFEAIAGSVDFEAKDVTELHYWRKHPDLHGWMRLLYREKDGTDSEFNCVNVRLDAKDLDRLEADIREKRLPRTAGPFFGESDGSEKRRRSRVRQQGARGALCRSGRSSIRRGGDAACRPQSAPAPGGSRSVQPYGRGPQGGLRLPCGCASRLRRRLSS